MSFWDFVGTLLGAMATLKEGRSLPVKVSFTFRGKMYAFDGSLLRRAAKEVKE